jgi:hypothetical protein
MQKISLDERLEALPDYELEQMIAEFTYRERRGEMRAALTILCGHLVAEWKRRNDTEAMGEPGRRSRQAGH